MQNSITNGLSPWAYETFHTEFESRIGVMEFFVHAQRENEATLWEYSHPPISAHDWTVVFANWMLRKKLTKRAIIDVMPDFRAYPDAPLMFVWWLEFLEEFPQRREYWQAWHAAFPDGLKLKTNAQ